MLLSSHFLTSQYPECSVTFVLSKPVGKDKDTTPGYPNPIPNCLKEHNHGKKTVFDITPMTDAELDDVLGARKKGWLSP